MHDQTIDDASGVMERKPKGRRRTVAMLLAAAVAMVTFGVSSATVAGADSAQSNPLDYTQPGGCIAVASGVASAKVTWSKPVPGDHVAGYLITIIPGAGDTSFADTPPPFGVTSPTTLTATIPNLVPGKHYDFVIQSVNEANQVNPALPAKPDSVNYGFGSACNPATAPIIPAAAGVPGPVPGFVFSTQSAAIIRHYQEFLQRNPNYSELAFWTKYFSDSNTLIGSCAKGGRGTNPAVQYGLSVDPLSRIGSFCPNTGPEFDLINFLYFGENNAVGQPFDTGGYYDSFNRKTYAGTAEPITRLYLAYFGGGGALATANIRPGGIPDGGGYKYWYNKYKAGKSLYSISDFFAHSSEFKKQYGTLSDADFVTLVYRNVLGRNEDFGGQNFWRGQLENGISRGQVMAKFSESDEYNRITSYKVKVITLYEALVGSVLPGNTSKKNGAPTAAEVDTVVNLMNDAWDSWCFNTARNEFQSVAIINSSTTTVASYVLRFVKDGETDDTGVLLPTATAATVQAALEALPKIGAGNVSVTGPAGGPYSVEFKGALANAQVPKLQAISVLPVVVAPAVQPSVFVAETQVGGVFGSEQDHFASSTLQSTGYTDLAGGEELAVSSQTCFQGSQGDGKAEKVFFTDHANEVQQITEPALGGLVAYKIDTVAGQTVFIPANATSSQVQTALEGVLGVGNVSVTGPAGGPYRIEFTGAYGNRDLPQVGVTVWNPGSAGTKPTTDTVSDGVTPHAGLGYYSSPIVQLIASIRNSPAYVKAVGKPASLI